MRQRGRQPLPFLVLFCRVSFWGGRRRRAGKGERLRPVGRLRPRLGDEGWAWSAEAALSAVRLARYTGVRLGGFKVLHRRGGSPSTLRHGMDLKTRVLRRQDVGKSTAPTAHSARARADSARLADRRVPYAIAVAIFSVVSRWGGAEIFPRWAENPAKGAHAPQIPDVKRSGVCTSARLGEATSAAGQLSWHVYCSTTPL